MIFDNVDSTQFDCYKKAVHDGSYNIDHCDMSDVVIHSHLTSFEMVMNSIEDLPSADKHIIIDNSPLPHGGASSGNDLTTMLQVRTDFTMTYNIKTLTVIVSLVAMVLSFLIFGVLYLTGKTMKDLSGKKDKFMRESGGQTYEVDE